MIEQKIQKRALKLEKRKADFLKEVESTLLKTWSLYTQSQAMIALAQQTHGTPLHTAALEFISRAVSSWRLPHQPGRSHPAPDLRSKSERPIHSKSLKSYGADAPQLLRI